MKLYIFSDVHGSATNLIRLLYKVNAEEKPVKLVLLGDIYNHGPRNPFPEGYAPMNVARLLNDAKEHLSVIKGNCDSEVDQMISEFPIYAGLSMQYNGHTLFFTHGHKCNPDIPSADAKEGDNVFYGHFHKAALTEKDGVKYVCVGAIGLSPEGVARSYAVIDENKVCVKTLVGDETIIEFEV